MRTENFKYDLPEGWSIATIDDLVGGKGSFFKDGDWIESKDQNSSGEVRLIQLADIGDGEFKNKSNRFMTLEQAQELNCTFLQKGDILIARMPEPLGRACIFPYGGKNKFVTVVDVAIVRTGPNGVNNRFLMNFINTPQFREKIKALQSGSTRKRISRGNLASIKFPLPPLREQNRIVSKVDELLSELENSIRHLELSLKQIEVYRQVILKNAFEGSLTKNWRAQNKYESSEKLLERIKTEREKKYEQDLQRWNAEFKKWDKGERKDQRPKKPRMPNQLSIFAEDKSSALPNIPESWLWEKLGVVCLKIMDGTHFSPRNVASGDFMYITAKNIREGYIDLNDITYVSEEDHKIIYERCDVKKGDVLYIKDGATTGRAAVNDISEEFSLLSSVAVFRTFQELVLPKFLEYYLNSEPTRKRMLSKTAGVAITRLTLAKLNDTAISLCPTEEQARIVEILDAQFSSIYNLEKEIVKLIQKSDILRQSILKKVFLGELVEQDPNDEPAFELLKLILDEKQNYLEWQKQEKRKVHKKAKPMSKELGIIDILKQAKEPKLALEVWQESKHKESIEGFYAELKAISSKVNEIRKGSESFLELVNED